MRRRFRLSPWLGSVYSTILERAMDKYFTHFPRNRSTIVAEDWDNLIILDACRYDMFEKANTIPGTLEHRLSKGSNTGEFFEGNFKGSQHFDTVYVTANPVPRVDEWCRVDVDTVFHDVVDVWKHYWDEEVNTVRPEPVANAIRKASADYPDKRIIGHFIQPHQPFIGKNGRRIEERGMTAYDKLSDKVGDTEKKVWGKLRDGELDTERVVQAYMENLELVLPHVERLCDELVGKTVVTSDHGNLFGEFAVPFPVRRYGHPRGIHTKKLVKVPWLETGFAKRRQITSQSLDRDEIRTGEDERLEKLKDLGYR